MSAPYSQQGTLLPTSFRPHTHTHSHTPVLPEGTIVPQAGPRTTAPRTTPYGPPRPAACRCRWRRACRWAPTAFSTSLLSCTTPTPGGCQRYVLLGVCQQCVVLSATAVQQLRPLCFPPHLPGGQLGHHPVLHATVAQQHRRCSPARLQRRNFQQHPGGDPGARGEREVEARLGGQRQFRRRLSPSSSCGEPGKVEESPAGTESSSSCLSPSSPSYPLLLPPSPSPLLPSPPFSPQPLPIPPPSPPDCS